MELTEELDKNSTEAYDKNFNDLESFDKHDNEFDKDISEPAILLNTESPDGHRVEFKKPLERRAHMFQRRFCLGLSCGQSWQSKY